MPLALGGVASSSSSNMGLDDNKEEGNEGKNNNNNETDNEGEEEGLGRVLSETSLSATEEEEDDEGGHPIIQLGPQYTLKEQLEKDKDDESLWKWREHLLGSVDMNNIGGN